MTSDREKEQGGYTTKLIACDYHRDARIMMQKVLGKSHDSECAAEGPTDSHSGAQSREHATKTVCEEDKKAGSIGQRRIIVLSFIFLATSLNV